MVKRVFFLLAGVAFGYVLIMSGVSNYDVIRDMFLMRSIHLYGVLAIAVGLSFVGVQLLRKIHFRSVLTGMEINTEREPPSRAHVVGGLLSGFGWALTGACPGPALAQIGFGTLAGLFTVTGIFVGIYAFGSLQAKTGETGPHTEKSQT